MATEQVVTTPCAVCGGPVQTRKPSAASAHKACVQRAAVAPEMRCAASTVAAGRCANRGQYEEAGQRWCGVHAPSHQAALAEQRRRAGQRSGWAEQARELARRAAQERVCPSALPGGEAHCMLPRGHNSLHSAEMADQGGYVHLTWED